MFPAPVQALCQQVAGFRVAGETQKAVRQQALHAWARKGKRKEKDRGFTTTGQGMREQEEKPKTIDRRVMGSFSGSSVLHRARLDRSLRERERERERKKERRKDQRERER